MGKKRRILFAAVVILVVAGLAWTLLGPHEHELFYQGKPLSRYLNDAGSNYSFSPDYKMLEAVYHMGPSAIPLLRAALHRNDSYREKVLRFLHAHLPQRLGNRLPATNSDFFLDKVASESAWCLEVFGPQARVVMPDLIACFNRPMTANTALFAVQSIGPRPEDLPQLSALLKSTNWNAANYAARCIAQAGLVNNQVFDWLTNRVANGSTWDRHGSINVLEQLGPKAAPAVPVLTRNLEDSDSRVRIASAQALWQIQQKSSPPTAWFIKELDNEINRGSPPMKAPMNSDAVGTHEIILLNLIGALAERGPDASAAAPLLRVLRSDENIRLRLSATGVLWKIDRETNDFVEIHSDALKNGSAVLQQWAAKELMEYCLEQHLVLPRLEQALASKDPAVAVYGARALWKLNGETERTIPALTAALDDHVTYGNTPEVRQLAADTLAEMGDKAKNAVPSLLAGLTDVYEPVRRASTNALKAISPAAAVKAGIK